MNSKLEYIRENLDVINKMIKENRPKFEIARVLNVKYATLNKYLKIFGINYKGNPNRKGIPHLEGRVLIEEYFNGNRNVTASKLRNKLIESGIKEKKCECCGLSEWMGKAIPLELHHKNFNHYDNKLDNLQILCSNCHSLAHQYCNTKGKDKSNVNYELLQKLSDIQVSYKKIEDDKRAISKKKKITRYCEACGKELTKSSQKHFCSYECSHNASRKMPSIEDLTSKLYEFNFNKSKTGRYFNVSDTAIDKWIKKYNIMK